MKRRRARAALALLVPLQVLLAAFFLLPLLVMVVSAFKPDELQLLSDLAGPRAFLPTGHLSLHNFDRVLRASWFLRALANSLLVAGSTVALGILVNSMLGYALARFRFRGRDLLLGGVVALVIIPFEAVAVPLLLLVNALPWFGGATGWLDTYRAQVLPFAANAFSVYLFHQAFAALPRDLEEAAALDGAGRWRTFWSISLPLARPTTATVAILQFLARWGDLLWPVMAVRSEARATLPLALQTFFGQYPRHWGEVMAFATLATLPTLALFLAFQRWFVRSAVSSGIKG
ncbi:MAG TPA: carbohydrate ABC transporter permease [Holophaga sp.]|nr:carbohydrate ABC transporter permease [Holophaga sp.]